mmetsp:Transcript_9215/g.23027  ORF Transcript_9215/g.23027 Transcript_9215/m.23027 type:complete len:254 (-) Transcript_9215:183-944(-)
MDVAACMVSGRDSGAVSENMEGRVTSSGVRTWENIRPKDWLNQSNCPEVDEHTIPTGEKANAFCEMPQGTDLTLFRIREVTCSCTRSLASPLPPLLWSLDELSLRYCSTPSSTTLMFVPLLKSASAGTMAWSSEVSARVFSLRLCSTNLCLNLATATASPDDPTDSQPLKLSTCDVRSILTPPDGPQPAGPGSAHVEVGELLDAWRPGGQSGGEGEFSTCGPLGPAPDDEYPMPSSGELAHASFPLPPCPMLV